MATATLLPEPEAQFCDANGAPYAGGTIETYVPGTTTPKSTWQDSGETVLNTNPIVLDAAGRAIIYGAGVYRFILRDANGNLIYDQLTSSSGDVTAETTRAEAAEANLQSQITAEVSRAEAAEGTLTGNVNTLTTNLNNEVTRAEAAEAHLQSEISALSGGTSGPVGGIRAGVSTTNSSSQITATFTPPFPTALLYFAPLGPVAAGPIYLGPSPVANMTQAHLQAVSAASLSSVTVQIYDDTIPYSAGVPIAWYAIGY